MTKTEKEIAIDEILKIVANFKEEINETGQSAFSKQCAANSAFCRILDCIEQFEKD